MNQEAVTSRCPLCKKIVKDAITPGFFDCTYKINGMLKRENGDDVEVEKVDLHGPRDKILIFEDSDDEKEEWVFVVIEVKANI